MALHTALGFGFLADGSGASVQTQLESLSGWFRSHTGGGGASGNVAIQGASASQRFVGAKSASLASTAGMAWQHPTNMATWCMGFALLNGASVGAVVIASIRDVTSIQADLRCNGDGSVRVTRNGTLLGASATGILTAGYDYIEFKALIADAGTYEVKVNGVTVLSGSGDTSATANQYATRAYFNPSSGTFRYADLYVADDFLGPVRVAALLPNGNGNSSQMTGSDGNSTDNYLLVDEIGADDDTTYVASATVGHKDTYAMSNLPSSPSSIIGVIQRVYAKKTDAGVKTGRLVMRSASTDYESSDKTLTDSYFYHEQIREVDPATSAAWSESAVNSMENGQKVQA